MSICIKLKLLTSRRRRRRRRRGGGRREEGEGQEGEEEVENSKCWFNNFFPFWFTYSYLLKSNFSLNPCYFKYFFYKLLEYDVRIPIWNLKYIQQNNQKQWINIFFTRREIWILILTNLVQLYCNCLLLYL